MHSKYSTIWAATHSQVTIDIIRDFGHKDANFLSIDQRTVKVLIRYLGRNISVKPTTVVSSLCICECPALIGRIGGGGAVVTSIVVQLQLQTSEKSYQCSSWVSSYCQIQKSCWWRDNIRPSPVCHTAWVIYWIIYTEFCHVQDLYCREQ